MNSSKLKWLLIIIFLAANIFFLHQYVTYSTDINNYTDREIVLASEILAESGSPISRSIIPKNKTTENVLKLEFSEQFHDVFAERVLFSDFASYVLPEGIAYSNDNETLLFTGEHSFIYSASKNVDPQKTIERLVLGASDTSSNTKLVKKLSDKLGISKNVSLSLISSYEKDGYAYIIAKESINGFTIDSATVTALFFNDSIIHIDGTVFIPNKVSEFSSDALDVINLLFSIETQNSEIVDIEELYYPVTTDNGAVYLTPSFKITYANGSVHLWDSTSCIQRY